MHKLIFILGLISLYGIFDSKSYLRKLFFLNIFQTSSIFFYLYSGYRHAKEGCCSPIPVVLMLTAIVVGFTIFSIGVILSKKLRQ